MVNSTLSTKRVKHSNKKADPIDRNVLKIKTKDITFHGTMQEIQRVHQRAGKFSFPARKKTYHGTYLAHEGQRSNMSINSRHVIYTYEFVMKCSERMWDN